MNKLPRVTRDTRDRHVFNLQADRSMMTWMESGVVNQIEEMYGLLRDHGGCDLRGGVCKVNREWLVGTYGSLEEANSQGARLEDCSRTLEWAHGELSRMYSFLNQIRYLHNNPEAHDVYAETEAVQQLARIKDEVRYREKVSAEDTQIIPAQRVSEEADEEEEVPA